MVDFAKIEQLEICRNANHLNFKLLENKEDELLECFEKIEEERITHTSIELLDRAMCKICTTTNQQFMDTTNVVINEIFDQNLLEKMNSDIWLKTVIEVIVCTLELITKIQCNQIIRNFISQNFEIEFNEAYQCVTKVFLHLIQSSLIVVDVKRFEDKWQVKQQKNCFFKNRCAILMYLITS